MKIFEKNKAIGKNRELHQESSLPPRLAKISNFSTLSRPSSTSKVQNASTNPASAPPEKSLESFSKLSELLAETQADIFELIENKSQGPLDTKTKLWEIFTYLNNKIWVLVFKPVSSPSTTSTSLDLQSQELKSKLTEANLMIQDLSFKLQGCKPNELKEINESLNKELKKIKLENKKMIEEFSNYAQETIFKDNKVSELLSANQELRNEVNVIRNESNREIERLKLQLEQVAREKDLLDDWKEKTDGDLILVHKCTKDKIETEQENEELIGKLEIFERNYRILKESYEEVEKKYWEKCKVVDDLNENKRKSIDLLRNKSKKNNSLTKPQTRNVSPLPVVKVKKGYKGKCSIAKQAFIDIKALNSSKTIEHENETKNLMMQDRIDKVLVEKSKIELVLQKELKAKVELVNTVNELQLEILKIRNQREAKEQEKLDVEKVLTETRDKVKELVLDMKDLNDKNVFLIKENNDLGKEVLGLNKKLSALETIHENCIQEKENWSILQEDYHTKIEDLQYKIRSAVDKDHSSIQNELKYAKVLIMKNQAEIQKLTKEKEILNHELLNRKPLNRVDDDDEEKIKDLENHILNLRSLLEVKEKIIREYGPNKQKNNEDLLYKPSFSDKSFSNVSVLSEHQRNNENLTKLEKENLNNQVSKLEAKLNECETKIADMRKEINAKEDEILDLSANLSLEKSTMVFVQEEISRFKSENLKLKSQINSLNTELSEYKKKSEKFQDFPESLQEI